jgi:WYL domain
MDNKLIFEAIALQKCIWVTYNRTEFKLAPYILYTRHGEIYLDAVPTLTNGRVPREVKLASFKIVGLSELTPTDDRFELEPDFDPQSERYAGTTLFAVEYA